jgi:glycosyltransferase involved in cell wall biosynthesis
MRFQKRHRIEAPYFLYLGALEARKNVTELIAAFDLLRTDPRHKGYELILAGAPGHRAHEIAKAAARSKSKSAIRILSRVTDEERKFLYNGAVAFACTSFFEGFGFPALEAQACGIPVVASARASFIETLADSALLVNPWKPSELADALMSLATNSKERAAAIRKGAVNIKRFDWNTAAGDIRLILKKTHHAFYG